MVDFSLPHNLPSDFIDLVPAQRAVVNRFLQEGKLSSYSLSLDTSKLWAIFNANSEVEVMDMIADFPLSGFMDVEISLLTFNHTSKSEVLIFSMN